MINKKATPIPGLRCRHCRTLGKVSRRKLSNGIPIYRCGCCESTWGIRVLNTQIEGPEVKG